jgi:hypothetical protein
VRIAADALARVGNADELEHADRVFVRLIARVAEVELGDLGELTRNPHERIQRRHRILENHADAASPHAAHLIVRQFQEIPPVEHNFARHDAARRRRDQPENRQVRDGLPRSRLANNSKRLAPGEIEADVVNRFRRAAFFVEPGPEMTNGQEGLVIGQSALPHLRVQRVAQPITKKVE